MATFICSLCETIENSATGEYWSKNINMFGQKYVDKVLCSCCVPLTYIDGNPTKYNGKWHGRFPKRLLSEYLLEVIDDTDQLRTRILGLTNYMEFKFRIFLLVKPKYKDINKLLNGTYKKPC